MKEKKTETLNLRVTPSLKQAVKNSKYTHYEILEAFLLMEDDKTFLILKEQENIKNDIKELKKENIKINKLIKEHENKIEYLKEQSISIKTEIEFKETELKETKQKLNINETNSENYYKNKEKINSFKILLNVYERNKQYTDLKGLFTNSKYKKIIEDSSIKASYRSIEDFKKDFLIYCNENNIK